MSNPTEEDVMSDLGDDAANAFLENLTGEEIPKSDQEEPKEDREDPEGETQEDQEEPEADEKSDKEPAEEDPDDAEVEVKVGETTSKAKMRDLKAAFARAAEVDARHVEVSTKLAKVQADEVRTTAALNRVLEKAQARWEPYSKLDFLALSRDPTIDQDTFAALRKEAQEALNDVRFYTEELDGQVAVQRQAQSAAVAAEAKATVEALSHPETGIKGWNAKVYGELLDYAGKAGAPKDLPQKLTGEWAIRMLHKAMLYDRGVESTATKIAKVIAKPTRTLNSSSGSSAGKTAADTTKSAMAALRKSGSTDDAADAFFASFAVED